MLDYTKEKFQIGDYVLFNVIGTYIKGTGEILGKALNSLAPMWIVMIDERLTNEMEKLEEKAIIVQENFIRKSSKN